MQSFEQNEVHDYDLSEQKMYHDLFLILKSCHEQKLTLGRNICTKKRGKDKSARKSIKIETISHDYDSNIDTIGLTEMLIWQSNTLLHNLLEKLGALYHIDRKAFDDFVMILRNASFVRSELRMAFKNREQVYRFAQIAVKLLDKKYWEIEIASRRDVKKSVNLNQELAQLKQETSITAKKSTHKNSPYTGFLILNTYTVDKKKRNGVAILQHVCFLLMVGVDAFE